MHDRSGDHHLLRQIPLTVSPSAHIPSAVTLPYTYQQLPIALPPSSTGNGAFIASPSGDVSSTPDAIITSCNLMLQALDKEAAEAQKLIAEWEQSIADRELMEKRRVAPGYLDTGLHMLEPTRKQAPATPLAAEDRPAQSAAGNDINAGDELDRLFGQMNV